MTGQIAFARTIRALDADDFRGPKLGLFFALILLGLWIWWFFAASIPQYKTSTNLELNQNTALADFPPTTQIHPGQPAQITLDDGQIINAQVEKVTNELTTVRVQFNLPPTTPATSHQPPATARVETARISPAAIVLHALHR
jgi:hypothetical protein